MASLAPVAPRLAKLIPMLSSDRDGEVVAAARAIGRTLAAADLDWHALASALAYPPDRIVYIERPPPSPPPQARRTPLAWRALAFWLAERADALTVKEADFCRQMRDRLTWTQRAPTPRQAAWMSALEAKLEARTR